MRLYASGLASLPDCHLSSGEFPLQAAVLATVPEVDGETDQQPDDQPYPGIRWQRGHQTEAAHDTRDGDERHPRGLERPIEIGPFLPENHDAGAHEHEREQRADVHELA